MEVVRRIRPFGGVWVDGRDSPFTRFRTQKTASLLGRFTEREEAATANEITKTIRQEIGVKRKWKPAIEDNRKVSEGCSTAFAVDRGGPVEGMALIGFSETRSRVTIHRETEA